MLITNYYRGSTDRLSGFTFDTEMKVYKTFVIPAKEWSHEWIDKNHNLMSGPLKGFTTPGDVYYYFRTKTELDEKLTQLKRLKFKEDKTMILDFGIFKK